MSELVPRIAQVAQGRCFAWEADDSATGDTGMVVAQDNVVAARRFADAFNRGLDEFMACHTEDVVHVTAPEWPERGTYHGRDQVRQLWASIFAEHLEHEIEVDEIIAVDEERVLSKLRWHATGASSGITTTTSVFTLARERDGLISRIEYFLSYPEALSAAGWSD